MTPLTFADYPKLVTNYAGTVVLFFTAPWAVPAVKTQEFLQSTNLHVPIYSIDYDSERELVQTYSVRDLPFLVVVSNGVLKRIAFTCETETDFAKLVFGGVV